MKSRIHRIGKFYSKIFMKYIGLFLFVGLMSVLFGQNGWRPNEGLSRIAEMAYSIIVPSLIGYAAGDAFETGTGGIMGLLATIGVIAANGRVGILGAMILGPVGGILSRYCIEPVIERTKASLHMLVRNLMLAAAGGAFCLAGYFLVTPILLAVSEFFLRGIDFLVMREWIVFGSVLIEPAKVFFFNNVINHAVLTPLGMSQVEEAGKSMLFLMESNPGPGLGVLFGLWCTQKDRREQYAAGMFVQGIGGIHEVYFPFVLARLRLLPALIAGGMAGTFCFAHMDAGLRGPVSPGSILTILIMAAKDSTFGVLLGIVVSFGVAAALSILLLKCKSGAKTYETGEAEAKEPIGRKEPIYKIRFVCDGGVGSSVMGAALFRRKLSQHGMEQVTAEACAADQIPPDTQMIVCQRDFVSLLPAQAAGIELFTLDNLVGSDNYTELLEEIIKRNG